MLLLAPVAALIAAISPLTIEVTTRDGHRFALPIADADVTALRVCARGDGQAERDAVCAPVVNDRHGSHVALDVDDTAGLQLEVMSTRFEARSGAPAAIAIGFGVGSVGTAIGAVIATAVATSTPVDVDADDSAAGASTVDVDAQTRDAAGVAAVGLWTATGVGVVATVVATIIAVGDANTVIE